MVLPICGTLSTPHNQSRWFVELWRQKIQRTLTSNVRELWTGIQSLWFLKGKGMGKGEFLSLNTRKKTEVPKLEARLEKHQLIRKALPHLNTISKALDHLQRECRPTKSRRYSPKYHHNPRPHKHPECKGHHTQCYTKGLIRVPQPQQFFANIFILTLWRDVEEWCLSHGTPSLPMHDQSQAVGTWDMWHLVAA